MRPSPRQTEIESQGAQRVPKQVDIHVWIVIAIIIAVVAWVMLS
jgi:hypothetical protein